MCIEWSFVKCSQVHISFLIRKTRVVDTTAYCKLTLTSNLLFPTYLPVNEDDGRMSAMSEAREGDVGEEDKHAANGGE